MLTTPSASFSLIVMSGLVMTSGMPFWSACRFAEHDARDIGTSALGRGAVETHEVRDHRDENHDDQQPDREDCPDRQS